MIDTKQQWNRYCIMHGRKHAVSEIDGEWVRTLCGKIDKYDVLGGPKLVGRECVTCRREAEASNTWAGHTSDRADEERGGDQSAAVMRQPVRTRRKARKGRR